jgi:hypothetical protein
MIGSQFDSGFQNYMGELMDKSGQPLFRSIPSASVKLPGI